MSQRRPGGVVIVVRRSGILLHEREELGVQIRVGRHEAAVE